MKTSDLYRWSGITGIATGVVNVIVELLPEGIGQPLEMLANILGLWVLAALYLRQRAASGVFGFIAYVIQSFGMVLVIGFLFTQAFVFSGLDVAQRAAVLAGSAGIATVIGLALTTIGAILFGIASWRAGLFPKWAAFLLMIGFVIVPIGAASAQIVKSIGEVVLSAGLIGMSYVLFSSIGDEN
jgi:hypothetical protein